MDISEDCDVREKAKESPDNKVAEKCSGGYKKDSGEK